MEKIVRELKLVLQEYGPLVQALRPEDLRIKTQPQKWSRQEILGHLVDSAQNNIRRFIVAQYEDQPTIVYRQDDWVRINRYQDWPSGEIQDLWLLLNKQILYILEGMSEAMASRTCDCNSPVAQSLAWLAADYIRHLRHHLHQLLDLQPANYP